MDRMGGASSGLTAWPVWESRSFPALLLASSSNKEASGPASSQEAVEVLAMVASWS